MPSSQITRHQALLKRLWWCCIIRDRSMGLLMRIPIQIRKDQFDFDASPFGVDDLRDEFERSKVYNPETKRVLAEIVAQWSHFNIAGNVKN
ncbi:hypothetical protein QQZ08_005359 [Neonectria magnoliae]|uniref:Transcription factor domain-containing protein n=1 Tax=Neonectria magnoliae TaxID=2732573 RepID=A0ABR1I533_9HYPO